MQDLPRGTVTFLFTDIEGSTRLLHELEDEYADVLAEHRRLVREAFDRQGGVEVDTQGDGFFYAFARATDAVAAADAAQKALETTPVRIRIGIHTGEPRITDEGYVGMDVHRAARVMSAGHGGQTVISETTARLLDPRLPLTDLGQHRLKDLSAPQRLYQLGAASFPPLKTLYRTTLPVVTAALVGRERELAEAGELLRSNRLVTLTGPGGSGKTRLAVHLAADAAEEFPDGVFWVPLQALRDPAIVERTIAAAVGADGSLLAHVEDKRMLLLLDNFEQLVDAAPVVASLLASTAHAKVIVTSREPLHVEAERQYPVDPLLDSDAAELFVERARAVVPSFTPKPAIGLICARLDCLPLAIELAAARVAILDVDDLLARLDKRLPLLSSRSRDAPARQRTLRTTIEWSYELLDADEQRLFRALSPFRGSFTVEAAEEVCESDVATLESLVVKNLVRRRWETGRLLLLDTIREYALEQLDGSPEGPDVHRRHAEFFLDVARSTNLDAGRLRPGGQRLEIAFAEQDNFRGALAWGVRTGEIALCLELATALEQFWVANDPREGLRWFERLLTHPESPGVPADVRAHALRSWGSSMHISGDIDEAERLFEQSHGIFEDLGDEAGRAVLLHRLSIAAMLHGDLALARERVEASHELHRRNDDHTQRTWGLAQTTGTLGAIARDVGDETRAAELIAESAGLAEEAGVQWWRQGMLAELAMCSLRLGRTDEAETHARESLELATMVGDRSGRIFGVGVLACLAAECGDVERAGRLWGAIEAEAAFAPLGGWHRHREGCEAMILRHATPAFERARAAGRELELDEAVTEALAAKVS